MVPIFVQLFTGDGKVRFKENDMTNHDKGQGLPNSKGLTRRESEILALQASGLGDKQIAEKLRISEHTVSNHLYSLRQTLGVHSGFEALAKLNSTGSTAAKLV